MPAPAGFEDVPQRVALVDRHELGAERFIRRVERQREADRRPLSCHPLDPWDPAHRRHPDVRVRDPDVREPLARGEHVVEVHERLAHAHEDRVVEGLHPPEVERLVEDLRRGQVAAELHPAGGAEGARERTPRLARQAQRPAPVAIAHQDCLHRPAVVRLEERLFGAVRGERHVHVAERGERDFAGEPLAQLAREVRHLLIRPRPASRPLPHLARAKARLLGRLQSLVKQSQVHSWKSLAYGACEPPCVGKG